MPMLFPPAPWTDAPLRLYHGTTEAHALAIQSGGVKVAMGRPATDFGRGFYTTTLERQAQTWAYQAAVKTTGARAAVLAFEVERSALAGLEMLAFVRGGFDAEDFWSLVVHCRLGGADHRRDPAGAGWYDAVVGPVASSWRQRLSIADVDQVSFHTPAAEKVINLAPRVITWTQSR
jgi:hypothetical protein